MGIQAPIILGTGAIQRYPLARKGSFATQTAKFADFSRQTFAQLATPLSQWNISLDLLTDAERNDWWSVHQAVQGSYAPFSFVDASENLLQYSEQQETSPWNQISGTISAAGSSAIADPFGVTSGRVRLLTIGAVGSYGQTIGLDVAPSKLSAMKGLTLTFSCYVQRVSSGVPTFKLFLESGSATEVATSATITPSASWVRYSVTKTFSITNPDANVIVGFNNFSATGSVYIFGAQLEVGGAVSGYKKTSNYCGFHPTCYFQSDDFSMSQSEFNVNSVQLVIEESN